MSLEWLDAVASTPPQVPNPILANVSPTPIESDMIDPMPRLQDPEAQATLPPSTSVEAATLPPSPSLDSNVTVAPTFPPSVLGDARAPDSGVRPAIARREPAGVYNAGASPPSPP